VGTAMIAIIGILWFKEPFTAMKIISITLIIFGVIGLNIGSSPK
jgi:small multidrug resistance pump